jgi:HEAT repeat protein
MEAMIDRVIQCLFEAWRWDDQPQVRVAAESLRSLGRRAFRALAEALRDEDATTRQAAAFALGVWGSPAARRLLLAQLAVEEGARDVTDQLTPMPNPET